MIDYVVYDEETNNTEKKAKVEKSRGGTGLRGMGEAGQGAVLDRVVTVFLSKVSIE